MLSMELFRAHSTQDGVFGRLGKYTTVEEQDLDNARRISCIPSGAYLCKRTRYNKGGYETFEILDVPGRTNILFHVANTEEDLEGCIGIASSLGVLQVRDEDTGVPTYKLAGLASKKAFDSFMADLVGIDVFVLWVGWVGQ